MKIAIIGLGYVGLPLSLQFARSGVEVLGLDIDPEKVAAINAGKSYIQHIAPEEVATRVKSGQFSASIDFSRVQEVEAAIICVPTPLNKNREPDISFILQTGEAIAPFLAPPNQPSEVGGQREEVGSQKSEIRGKSADIRGRTSEVSKQKSASFKALQPSALSLQPWIPKLVVLESTTYPGTTDEDLRGVLEKGSGLKAGVDFHLAFSPEREDPGNPQSKVAVIPKVIGGLTPACRDRALALYGRAIQTLVPVSSCRVAEATKLLENIFRGVNIALVNELKVVYAAMGIDVWEVINAAKSKPFGFMPFYPGPGLGGHCIPLDPFYLTWKAREYGQNTRFIELAGEVNTRMPEYVVARTFEALNSRKKPVNGSRILVLGLAYKPNVDDMRESPSYVLMDLLTKQGAQVSYYDPHIPVVNPTREHAHWTGMRSVKWSKAVISQFDVVLISTAHQAVDYRQLAQWASCIVDTRNAMASQKTKPGQVWKA